jgi:hypothetical protein
VLVRAYVHYEGPMAETGALNAWTAITRQPLHAAINATWPRLRPLSDDLRGLTARGKWGARLSGRVMGGVLYRSFERRSSIVWRVIVSLSRKMAWPRKKNGALELPRR